MMQNLTNTELGQRIKDLELRLHQMETSENQYRYLVDSTSDSLYLVDEEGRYIFINDNHLQRLNLPAEEMVGYSYNDFHSPQQSEDFAEKVKQVFITGQSIQDEHHSPNKKEYFLRTFSPVRKDGNSQKNIAVAIVSKDITDRKQTEEALQRSEEKYRLLIENSNEAIFIIQSEKITFANKRLPQMLGYNLPEILNTPFLQLILEEDRDMVCERQQSSLQGKDSTNNYIFRIINKDGSTHWAETNSVVINWDNQPATLNFLRDITSQKKTEARLLQAKKMESIGTLAGGIAHDFNNLLMGIQGHASLAILLMDPQSPIHGHLKTIEGLVMSGAELTKQLLGFARGGKYEVKTTDINSLICRTSETIGRTKKEITIHHNLATDLWLTDVDSGQIDQVLLNLYVNAWQAMPGGGDLYLRTSNVILEEKMFKDYNGKNGRYVKISVTDTGVGMDEKTKERIFEPFFTTKEMGRGAGLGLASVYGIIKNHNGFINVYSEKGQGSTFNIYLPASAHQEIKEQKTEQNMEISRGTETILLVDDESLILDVAKDLLIALGYKVFTAHNGTAAMDIYKQSKETIDLVILDMVMPEMNGGEIFDELKKINPAVKVLLSSGYSINGQASKIISRGCVGFIQKPFTMLEIASQLRKILDDRSCN
jgi:two-component system, cell cycle sensor histidine kinase and response regulator CckA